MTETFLTLRFTSQYSTHLNSSSVSLILEKTLYKFLMQFIFIDIYSTKLACFMLYETLNIIKY